MKCLKVNVVFTLGNRNDEILRRCAFLVLMRRIRGTVRHMLRRNAVGVSSGQREFKTGCSFFFPPVWIVFRRADFGRTFTF